VSCTAHFHTGIPPQVADTQDEALQTGAREYDRALDQGHRKMNAENLSIAKSKEFISLKT
jgi:hypothetical protein